MNHLRPLIERAFPLAPIPQAPILRTYDDEDIIPTFLGRPWNSFTVRELREHEAAITFLTAEALIYYLPAFLIATIDDRDLADILPDNLLHTFGGSEAPDLVARLNAEQREVLAQFFSELVGDDPCSIRALVEALDNLTPKWNQREGRA